MNEVVFDCRWSGEVTPDFVGDFISVLECVWGENIDLDSFRSRYFHNIYGPSLMIVTYVAGYPSGTQAFWRNDIGRRLAYQADDGAVLEASRGKGLLRRMIQKGMEVLGNDVMLYSFPNSKSKPSFLKLGWDVISTHPVRLLMFNRFFPQQCPQEAEYVYAKWFLRSRKHISYVKRNGYYFLVIPTSRRYVRYIISSCDEKTAMLFEKQKGWPLLVYNKQSNTIDAEKKGNIVVMGHRGEFIPVWKCDAI